MPLTAKGEKIMGALEKEYSPKSKAEGIFYALKNEGKISGVDCDMTAADYNRSRAGRDFKPMRDLSPDEFDKLKRLLGEWVEEEKDEPEHQDAAPPKAYELRDEIVRLYKEAGKPDPTKKLYGTSNSVLQLILNRAKRGEFSNDEWSPEARKAAAEARRKGGGSGYGPNGENLNKGPKEREAARLKKHARQAQQGINERFNNKPFKY